MASSTDSHLDLIEGFLKDNVLAPPKPIEVIISDIDFDWDALRGTFQLTLDNTFIMSKFGLYIDIAGRINFNPPMFISPLGAPASFSAVDLDSQTRSTIVKALETIFPKIRGYGIYKDIGIEIWAHSPLKDRIIDPAQFKEKSAIISNKKTKVRMFVDR